MTAQIISLIGILVALTMLIILCYKGASLLLVGPLAALVCCVFAWGSIDIVGEGMLNAYATGLGNYMKSNFLMFILGSMFGRLTGDSGTGKTIALKLASGLNKIKTKTRTGRIALTVLLIAFITTILTLGGVSSFVIIFTMVGIMKPLFEAQDIPWHLSLCGLTIGSQVFTSVMIPGSPAIQNLIPIEYLGTNAKAAPVLGLLSAACAIVFCVIYVFIVSKKADRENEYYLPTGAVINTTLKDGIDIREGENISWGQFIKAIAPSAVLLIVLNVFNFQPVSALFTGIVVNLILYWKKIPNVMTSLGEGAFSGAKTLISVAAAVGFGNVVKVVPGYEFVCSAMDKIPGPPIVQLVIATNIIAGITGSASGGLGIALETFGQRFLDMGIHPEIVHRVASMSCYGLDSLPHNGSIINMINTAGLTHKNAYKHFLWCTVIIPVFVSVLSIIFVEMGIM